MEKQLIKFEETETSIPFIKVKHNNIEFNLSGIDFEEEFNAIDFGGMYHDVKDSFGITVRGLLGSEFMYRNHLILDFNNSIIRYTDGRQTSLDFGESEQPETTCKS